MNVVHNESKNFCQASVKCWKKQGDYAKIQLFNFIEQNLVKTAKITENK